MKKQFSRRATVIIIAACMLAALFAGCQKEDEDGTATKTAAPVTTATAKAAASSAKTTAKAATASTAAETASSGSAADSVDSASVATTAVETDEEGPDETIEEPEDEIEEVQIDMKGKEIIVSWHDKGRIPYADATVEKLQILWKNAKYLEEKYNCKFVFEASASLSAHQTSITTNALAGTEYRTVIFAIEQHVFPSLVEGGYFLAMDDYIDKESDLWKDQIEGPTKWGDKHWGFTETSGLHGGQNACYYDEALLQREGVPDIWELAMNFNWTWNEFVQIATALTKDLDGDAIIDQWGLMGDTPQQLCELLVYVNGGRFFEMQEGKPIFALNTPKAVKALQFVSDLYNVYKVIPQNASLGGIKNYLGKVGMTLMKVTSGSTSVWLTPDQGSTIRIAPVPLGPDSEKGKYMTGYRVQHEMFLIPANINEKAETVTVVAEWFRRNYLDLKGDERWDVLKAGGEIWLKNLNPEINLPRLITINEMGYGAAEPLSIFNPLQSELKKQVYDKIIKLETPVTAALEANKDVMQNYIDEKCTK